MRVLKSLGCLVLGGALLVGCDSSESTPNTPKPPTADQPARTPADAVRDGVKEGADQAREAGEKAKEAAKDAGEKAKDAANNAADKAKDAANNAADTGSALAAQAQEQLDQAIAYIKENKLDLAEKALDGLDKIKDSLSPALQSQLANARKMLDAARNKPAMPALPGDNK